MLVKLIMWAKETYFNAAIFSIFFFVYWMVERRNPPPSIHFTKEKENAIASKLAGPPTPPASNQASDFRILPQRLFYRRELLLHLLVSGWIPFCPFRFSVRRSWRRLPYPRVPEDYGRWGPVLAVSKDR